MNSGQVLGVSVGAGGVRVAYLHAGSPGRPVFGAQTLAAAGGRPEELAAVSIGTALAEGADGAGVQAVGVACRDQTQAGAVRAALAGQRIGNCRLVPEVAAALRMLERSGELGDHSTLVFYDLGSSGLTVTVVERPTGAVLGTARTDRISGDLVDRLIRDHQLDLQHIARPADAEAGLALDARCRHAKEQLCTDGGAVCVPGDGGLLLLSQDTFDSLVEGPVEASAHLVREVVDRSGCIPDAVVLLGGGARIPLVRSATRSWLDLPVIVPEQPELVAARGAALLAEMAVGQVSAPMAAEAQPTAGEVTTPMAVVARPPAEKVGRHRRRGAALAGGALAVVAAVGLGVGYGGALPQGPEETALPVTSPPSTPAPTVEAAPPPTAHRDDRPAAARADQATTQPPVPAPEPGPAPPPGPVIPGLPQIQLPPLRLPPLPRLPGL
ncbi:Hsp70 family protein [Rhodococcus opacus]|uniref:Hsp70 family protein n=2 Tax=Rhodococcus opacus TaxID=37919 RepID=UPI00042EA8C2|nr:Hsp70 family protein [Rhodococcus opacus]AHK35357.1 Chaperone protein hscA [Rhodococcus opacus PD630]